MSSAKIKLLTLLLLVSFTFTHAQSKDNQNKLIVFHFDFNSVSLQKDYIIKWLDKASVMGYNAVLWEIEDDVKWNTCPESSNSDAFSKDEFKSIIEYSRKVGLEPIPLLQTIGHAEYVLQHKKYFQLREDSTRYDCYCTTNINVKEFIKKWIEEYLEIFGDVKYFHLGGDEAYAFATCNNCKSYSEKYSKNKLYADYLNEISQPLKAKNIRPCVWSDMILSHPDQLDVISKDFVLWDWNYWDGDSTPERVMVWGNGRLTKDKITSEIYNNLPQIFDQEKNLNAFYTSDFLKDKGYDVVLCSSSRCYGDAVFVGQENLHVDNIVGAARKTSKLNLLGNCVTSWAVRIPNFETQELWFSLAPLTLSNPTLSKKDLVRKNFEKYFNIDEIDLSVGFEKIGFSFPFSATNTTGIMWTGLKDSRPAPKNYIKSLIEKWKARNQWNDIKEQIEKASLEISCGINKLNSYIPKISRSYELLNNWSKAAYFQYWQSVIANMVIKHEMKADEYKSDEIIVVIKNIRNEYKNWASEWMTEKSAEMNAGLIYDVFLSYFNNN